MSDLETIVTRNAEATENGVREYMRTEELLNEYTALSRTPSDRLANARVLRAIMAALRQRFPAPAPRARDYRSKAA